MYRFHLFPNGNIIFYVTNFIYRNTISAWYKCAIFIVKMITSVYFHGGNNWKRIRSFRFGGLNLSLFFMKKLQPFIFSHKNHPDFFI